MPLTAITSNLININANNITRTNWPNDEFISQLFKARYLVLMKGDKTYGR